MDSKITLSLLMSSIIVINDHFFRDPLLILLFVSEQTFTIINGSSVIKGNFVNAMGDTVTRFAAKVSKTYLLSFIQTFL